MSDTSKLSSKRVLEPIERISEVLFGLIMVLGFTGSLSAGQARFGELIAIIQLYKAPGGGWQNSGADPNSPASPGQADPLQ